MGQPSLRFEATLIVSFDAHDARDAAKRYETCARLLEGANCTHEGGQVELYLSMAPEDREAYRLLYDAT